jgi:hypothetical protein
MKYASSIVVDNGPLVSNLSKLKDRHMAVVIDRHSFSVPCHWPGERNHEFEASQGYPGLEFAVRGVFGPRRENGEQVALDQVRLVYASRNIHPIRLFVVETYPSF